ncbi:hypothetical protein LPJ59_001319 [Coemansia sp. RSA 2399]|nr:hypothetical protein LPJ59_001319 [Coemansia sp. RSA 2399]KAJ1906812.1 hypothetical protein LPJ81_001142 [Coemansia sp. IMI 209127]
MAERYSKVLTWRNMQLFVGGTFLTGTIGYTWLKPRIERTAELQQRLRRVKQHMYWSMSFVQRTKIVSEESLCRQRKQQKEYRQHQEKLVGKANTWWNGQLADFAVWAVEPGHTKRQAGLALTSFKRDLARVWMIAKRSASMATVKAIDNVKDGVRWDETMSHLKELWHEEKSKWSLAHMKAIEAVHPLYEQEREQQQTASDRPAGCQSQRKGR